MTFPYKGYTGRYLRVDLTRGKTLERPMKKEWARHHIGGSGIGARILYDEVPPRIDALSPNNRLVFATGPVTGTIYPPSGRYCVVAKSPLTGIWGESHVGGYLGPELKFAGYDLIVFQGQARKPMYLAIEDGHAKLLDAKPMWGHNTSETTEMLEEEFGRGVHVACIGQAGENLVRFASIMSDRHRVAGRSGMGGVMGSKRLKAIALKGEGDVEVANFDRVYELAEEANVRYTTGKWGEACKTSLGRYGTTSLVASEQAIGRLPTKNHWTGVFEYSEDIGPERIRTKYRVGRRSCFNCRIQCKYMSRVEKGKYAGTWARGPEYETLYALGSNCLNQDLESILHANMLCALYGMDTISCGKVISFAMECYERGLLSKRKLGMSLEWGDGDAIVKLIHAIAQRKGFGKVLAEGVRTAAKRIGKGAERYAMHIKGMEISGQDGRAHQSVGLSHAIAVRGADHLRALSSIDELGYTEVAAERFGERRAKDICDLHSTRYKGILVKDVEDLYAMVDSLITCKYGTMWPPMFYFDDYARLLPALTGIEEFARVAEVRAAAERIVNLKRAFNARLGLSRKDDTLPHRLLKDPMPYGPAKGKVVDLKPMLDEYYHARGWEIRTGLQKRQTLERFGLTDVARDLAKCSALAKG